MEWSEGRGNAVPGAAARILFSSEQSRAVVVADRLYPIGILGLAAANCLHPVCLLLDKDPLKGFHNSSKLSSVGGGVTQGGYNSWLGQIRPELKVKDLLAVSVNLSGGIVVVLHLIAIIVIIERLVSIVLVVVLGVVVHLGISLVMLL